MGSLRFCVMTITDHRMPHGKVISALSLAFWWAKLNINKKIMTQMASLLAVVTVIILMDPNINILKSERGLYARQNYLCRNLN